MGGIYTLGLSEGTMITNNVIHNAYDFANGSPGIYNDEGSSGITMRDNLIYDVSWAYNENHGRNNTLENNIFAFCSELGVRHPLPETGVSLNFNHNIVYGTGTPLLVENSATM